MSDTVLVRVDTKKKGAHAGALQNGERSGRVRWPLGLPDLR